jgi:hypothetical protein
MRCARKFRFVSVHFDCLVFLKLRGHGRDGDGVAVRAQPVEPGLDQGRPLFGTRALGGLANLVVNLQHVGPVHGGPGNAVGFGLFREWFAGDGVGVLEHEMRIRLIHVILENENDR